MAGYLRATWLALPMLAFYPGPDSEPFHRALAVVETSYAGDWQGGYLAWLLRCLHDAGLPADHPLAARCLADLDRTQRPDGSWAPEEGEGEVHAVNATLGALRALQGVYVLGALEEFEYTEKTITLQPGEMLLIFSDGISESQNDAGEEFGEERLAEIAAAHSDLPAVRIIEHIMQAVNDFTGDKPQFDDMTVLIVKRAPS